MAQRSEVPKLTDGAFVLTEYAFCVRLGRLDHAARQGGPHHFATTQSPLGQSLYRHYGFDIDSSYLLIDGGQGFTESAGYLRVAKTLGGWWHLWRVAAIIPVPLRDAVYGLFARNVSVVRQGRSSARC